MLSCRVNSKHHAPPVCEARPASLAFLPIPATYHPLAESFLRHPLFSCTYERQLCVTALVTQPYAKHRGRGTPRLRATVQNMAHLLCCLKHTRLYPYFRRNHPPVASWPHLRGDGVPFSTPRCSCNRSPLLTPLSSFVTLRPAL